MNANTLLKLMQRGAILQTRWKPRTIGKPKMRHTLSGPGYTLRVQWSAIAVLIGKAKVCSQYMQAGERDYKLNGNP